MEGHADDVAIAAGEAGRAPRWDGEEEAECVDPSGGQSTRSTAARREAI